MRQNIKDNIRENFIAWLLGLLLVGGFFWHDSRSNKLHQQILTLQVEAEKSKAQATNLGDRLPALQVEIGGLKDTLKQLNGEVQDLRDKLEDARTAAESSDEIAEFLESDDVKKKAADIQSRLAASSQAVERIEGSLGGIGQQVSNFQAQQRQLNKPSEQKSIPAGASAICRDGTFSFSQNRRGTCSHHGGVAQWL